MNIDLKKKEINLIKKCIERVIKLNNAEEELIEHMIDNS